MILSTSTSPRTLTIAGSDSGGGAGIQADLKTFEAFSCLGLSAITVLTAQNTLGVQDLYPVTPEFLKTQIDSVVSDIGVDSVKLGMLYSTELIEVVSLAITRYQFPNLIVDPVMVAKGGSRLLREDAINAMKYKILGKANLITPNTQEAELLTGCRILDLRSLHEAMNRLLEMSPRVLLKGGHFESGNRVLDFYSDREGLNFSMENPRIQTRNTHGTGCTLAAAITALRARGSDWTDAILNARKYIQGAITAHQNTSIGKGHGPLKHSFMNLGVTK